MVLHRQRLQRSRHQAVLPPRLTGQAQPGQPVHDAPTAIRAAGEPLWFGQADVRTDGHAVQARIAAEDPWEGFRPAPGKVRELVLPQGPWVRNDMGVAGGDAVPAEYDSLIGKVLAWGTDREVARRRLIGALDELCVVGVPTTAPYLRGVIASGSFAAGTHDTGSVAREWAPDPAARPAAAPPPEPASSAADPTAGAGAVRRVRIATDRGPVEVAVHGRARPVAAPGAPAARPTRTREDSVPRPGGPGAPPVAPMDATVVLVPVTRGQPVAAGEVLAVLEAMKMEIEVRAGVAGTVAEVLVAVGDPVSAGAPLVVLTA